MEPTEASALISLARPRFRSFSEAAESLLGALAKVVPGTVALARSERGGRVLQVVEARGEGLSRLVPGVSMPPLGEGVDSAAVHALGAQDWLSAPLETSNGQIVGVLCAGDTGADVYAPEHAAELAVAARLLSHEWESVELRAELRRLRARVNVGPGTDAETGLPSRSRFLEQLDHEWRLAKRGTVESVLVACTVGGGKGENGGGADAARRSLILKVAAEVLEGSTRVTDRVGRIGEAAVGAILVGCPERDTPAFVARFLSALDRVTGEGELRIEVTCGVQSLAEAASAEEALALAEAAAEESGGVPAAWLAAGAAPE